MFIVDIEKKKKKKKKNIKVNNKIKMNFYSKKQLSLIISKNKI